MARAQWRSGPRQPQRPGGLLTSTLVAALALVGCGTISAADVGNASAAAGAPATGGTGAAGGAGAADSGQASTTSGTPLTARQLLCARPAAASRIVIARTGFPHLIMPGRPGLPVWAGRPHQVVQPNQTQPNQTRPNQTQPNQTQPNQAQPWLGPRPIVVKVVTSASRARALAVALCALPRMPRGPVNCPALFTGSYQLAFTADGRKLPVVSIQDSGCQQVTGLGAVRSAANRPAFRALLSKTAGPIPITVWPGHLPVGPIAPGTPLRPVDPGLSGCAPPTDRTPPGMSGGTCPGPFRPGGVPQT